MKSNDFIKWFGMASAIAIPTMGWIYNYGVASVNANAEPVLAQTVNAQGLEIASLRQSDADILPRLDRIETKTDLNSQKLDVISEKLGISAT